MLSVSQTTAYNDDGGVTGRLATHVRRLIEINTFLEWLKTKIWVSTARVRAKMRTRHSPNTQLHHFTPRWRDHKDYSKWQKLLASLVVLITAVTWTGSQAQSVAMYRTSSVPPCWTADTLLFASLFTAPAVGTRRNSVTLPAAGMGVRESADLGAALLAKKRQAGRDVARVGQIQFLF